CGLAANGKEAYDLCMREKPDVVLMDMRMPKGNGDVIAKRIKESLPETKVIIVTVFDDKRSITAALASKVDGYILKEDIEKEKLIGTIKNTYDGVNSLNAGVFNKVSTNMYPVSPPDNLTEKETKIVALLGNARSNQEIAEELCCSIKSTRNDVSRLLKKFGFRDRSELAVYAVKNGLDKWEGED
ncbi:MAG: response regulator transcription factor, partial [Peptococcaceae bacterium]|nr:response regulator transcription factor [Peptococcaceae bacterium]